MSYQQPVPKGLLKELQKIIRNNKRCYRLYYRFDRNIYCFDKEVFHNTIDLNKKKESLEKLFELSFMISPKVWGEDYGFDAEGLPVKWPIDPSYKMVVKFPDGTHRHISQQYSLR